MRKAAAFLSGIALIAYVIYRAFTTVVIMPLVAGLFSSTGIYFGLLLLLAIGTSILSFTRYKGVAGLLSIALGVSALLYWWIVICGRTNPIWTDFSWFVIPEMFFVAAVLSRWLLTPKAALN